MRPPSDEPEASIPEPSPTAGMSDVNTPQKALKTPVKSMPGHLFNSHQYKTPTARPHIVYFQEGSPHLRTPTTTGVASGGVLYGTPKSWTPYSAGSRKTPKLYTPNGVPYNPFDSALMDALNGPVFSPNVFANASSVEKTPKTFRWSIDQLAILKPADIEEMPQQDNWTTLRDQEGEKKAQMAIDAFFDNHLVAPSPWTDSAKKTRPQLPRTPGAEFVGSPLTFSNHKALKKQSKQNAVSCIKKEAACQTTLTLPNDFDLYKVLAEHHSYKQSEENMDLSSSSLRRKLFFQGEAAASASPAMDAKSRLSETMDFDISPDLSPVKCATPKHQRSGSPLTTPASEHFSSSPIMSSRSSKPITPSLRRYSTFPDMMNSPKLSPIGDGFCTSERDERRSSDHVDYIPLQATPSSGRKTLLFDSPGMSPITQDYASHMITPSSGQRQSKNVLEPLPAPAELQPGQVAPSDSGAIRHLDLSDDSLSEDMFAMEMDLEGRRLSPIPVTADNASLVDETDRKNFQALRNFTDYDAHYETGCTAHDTGYNTNSLQLTNQDTGIHSGSVTQTSHSQDGFLHTNLTTQFGGLFPSSSNDTGINEEVTFDMDHIGGPFSSTQMPGCDRPLSCDVGFDDVDDNACDGEDLREAEILHRARHVLGKPEGQSEAEASVKSVFRQDSEEPIFPWYPSNAVTPQKRRIQSMAERLGQEEAHKYLPSEVALHFLKRAGDDLAKYCGTEGVKPLEDATTKTTMKEDVVRSSHVTVDPITDTGIVTS